MFLPAQWVGTVPARRAVSQVAKPNAATALGSNRETGQPSPWSCRPTLRLSQSAC
jgi:hypothetical protein